MLLTKNGQIRPYRPHWFATRRLLIYITQRDDRHRVAETLIARSCPSKLSRDSRSAGFQGGTGRRRGHEPRRDYLEPEILVVDGIPKGRLFGDLSLKMTLKMSPKNCLNNPLLDSIFQSLYL